MRYAIPILVAGMILAGCRLPQPRVRAVSHFALNADTASTPEMRRSSANLEIGRFDTIGPYDHRMVYRKSPTKLVRDEYNRWIEPPERLLRHAVYRALVETDIFETVSPVPVPRSDLRLDATILRWETDPDLNAVIEVNVRLTAVDTDAVVMTRYYVQTQKLQSATPEHFADAASMAVQHIIRNAMTDAVTAYESYRHPQTQGGP